VLERVHLCRLESAGDVVTDQPKPISALERGKRFRRISAIGSDLGFVGEIEYRHVYSQSGGAQYCIGPTADDDIMILYAEAFERDADPEEFNLDAVIAHECGHQRIIRDPKIREICAKVPSAAFEEVLASLVGAILLGDTASGRTLLWRAATELSDMGMSDSGAVLLVERVKHFLEGSP
jgi:hypothetical protein